MHRLSHIIGISIFLASAAVDRAYGAIDEVIVTAAPTEDRVFPPSVELDHEALQELQPVATADVFRNLTGVAMRTRQFPWPRSHDQKASKDRVVSSIRIGKSDGDRVRLG